MRVLVMESDPYAADKATKQLDSAGHDVERCFERDLGNFPCNALYAGGRCPLDDGTVDVALVVRGHAWPSAMPLERGAVCAIRAGVPLVEAGVTVLSPFERWATVSVDVDDDIVEACVAAASSGHANRTLALAPGTTVGSALAALASSGRHAALVEDRGTPLGVVTHAALRGRASAVPRRDARVEDVMDWECARTDPGSDVLSTLRSHTDGAWTSLRRRRPCADDVLARRAAAFDRA